MPGRLRTCCKKDQQHDDMRTNERNTLFPKSFLIQQQLYAKTKYALHTRAHGAHGQKDCRRRERGRGWGPQVVQLGRDISRHHTHDAL